ncbi:MAG: response regulator [Verrucomicrobiales bacterium]|nr:response regulator [Verrucomicrobiales bacterium]
MRNPFHPHPNPLDGTLAGALLSAATREHRGRVLFAESDETTRTVTSALLGQAGFEVDAVEDGETAWNLLARRSFDAVVAAGDLPKLDGLALVRRLRGSDIDLPVVILSGHLPLAVQLDYYASKVSAILSKPVRMPRLITTLLDAMAARATTRVLHYPRAA